MVRKQCLPPYVTLNLPNLVKYFSKVSSRSYTVPFKLSDNTMFYGGISNGIVTGIF